MMTQKTSSLPVITGIEFDIDVGMGRSIRGAMAIEQLNVFVVGGELVDNHTHQAHPYDATRTCSEAHISLKYFAVSMVYSILLGMAHTALCGRTPNRRYLPKLRECAELIVSRHTKAKKINTQPCLAQKEE